MKKSLTYLLILCLSLIISCAPENPHLPSESSSSEQGNKSLIDYLLKIGYKKDEIKIYGNRFIVQGDMEYNSENDYSINSINKQNINTTLGVNGSYFNVYIEPGIADLWINASKEAIERWNSINCNLYLNLVTSSSLADIIITDNDIRNISIQSNYLSIGSRPFNGDPGEYVTINNDFSGKEGCSNGRIHQGIRIADIQHELGHTLGLGHTEDDPNLWSYIQGTSLNDKETSLMRAGAACLLENFSEGDVEAIQILFGCEPDPNIPNLSAYIIGPTKGNNSGTYTWEVNVSGGMPPYTFEWKKSYTGSSTSYTTFGVYTSSYTAHLPLDKNLYLKCYVTDVQGTVVSDYFVTLNDDAGTGVFKP
ncbi:hypothetical protein [Christiangramia echinicola]|uniref:hypothetical protein n=1 Tax=Christiangramia echinicola TaxID=279359 RepID=UPI0004099B04|nr:hypothetical protein [Christiangramia echinicola]